MRFILKCGLLLCVVFLMCHFVSCEYQSPYYIKLAHQITAKTAQKIEKNKQLVLIGTGGQMMYDIQVMDMSFNFYREVDLKTARKLMIDVIDEYLLDINSHEKIRPYLHNYPFTAKNVEIRIFVYGADRRALPPEQIYYVSAIDGILNYYIRDVEKDARQAICKESYEEAVQAISNKSI